jgi:hypothetical protein
VVALDSRALLVNPLVETHGTMRMPSRPFAEYRSCRLSTALKSSIIESTSKARLDLGDGGHLASHGAAIACDREPTLAQRRHSENPVQQNRSIETIVARLW